MKTRTEKSPSHSAMIHRKPFFSKGGTQAFFPASRIQPKLTIGAPNDKYEQEADRVADQVMNSSGSAQCLTERGTFSGGSMAESQVHRQTMEENEKRLQKKTGGGVTPEITPAVGAGIHSLQGGGQPLPGSHRDYFEPRFGVDFSHVRIHTNPEAAQSAQSINAMAYTVGQNVVFGHGQYAPDTTQGRHLLAHELAHVRQNSSPSHEPVIRRYEAPEHQDIGDRYLQDLLVFLQGSEGETWASQIGMSRDELVTQIQNDPQYQGTQIERSRRVDSETGEEVINRVSPGQIIALMGDLYESVDDLVQAPESEIRSLIDIIEGERAGTITNSSQRFQEATQGRPTRVQYLELAKRNDTHFARQNQAEWLRLHVQSLAVARQAARQAAGQAASESSQSLLQRALLIDAAAGHFLSDSYASGHLFDKAEVLPAIALHLQSSTVLANNPEMQAYIGIVDLAGQLPQLVLKNVHDRMNREGFIVRNAAGMQWRTFGDDYLALAEETQRVAALAVFLSRQQVYQAYRGESPNPDLVQSLMPNDDTVTRATYQALGYIPQAVRGVEQLIYRNRALSPLVFGAFIGNIIEINLSNIGFPGRERILADALDRARETGLSLTPSITLPVLGTPDINVGPSIFTPQDESGAIPGLTLGGRF